MDRRHLAGACVLASIIAGASLNGGARADAPSTSVALLALARQAEAGDRDRRAAELYRQAHQANPFDPVPLSALGRLAVRIGAPDEAVTYFEAALTIERRDRATRHGLAGAFVELERTDEALALYEALLADDPADGEAWNGKGLVLDLAGRHDDAQTAYLTALALAPEDDEIRANLVHSRSLAAAPAAEPPASPDSVALALNAEGPGPVAEAAAPPHSTVRDP